jgi:hypothetical protein
VSLGKYLLQFLGVGVLIVGGFIAYLWLSTVLNKHNIDANFRRVALPANFRLTSATYRSGSIDVAPEWRYDYRVSGTRQTVYDQLKQTFEAAGFTIDPSSAQQGWLTARQPAQNLYINIHLKPNSLNARLTDINVADPVDAVLIEAMTS